MTQKHTLVLGRHRTGAGVGVGPVWATKCRTRGDRLEGQRGERVRAGSGFDTNLSFTPMTRTVTEGERPSDAMLFARPRPGWLEGRRAISNAAKDITPSFSRPGGRRAVASRCCAGCAGCALSMSRRRASALPSRDKVEADRKKTKWRPRVAPGASLGAGRH